LDPRGALRVLRVTMKSSSPLGRSFGSRPVGALGALFVSSSLALGALWMGALTACDSLADTSPIPNGDASDLDAGFGPVPAEGGPSAPPSTVDAGPSPPSGRIRLANLIQGAGPVDLCAKGDAPGSTWDTKVAKPGGLAYGEVSAHSFVSVPTSAGSKYQF